jgi:hypothetical protein
LDLLEISLVDIPSNPNTVRILSLSIGGEDIAQVLSVIPAKIVQPMKKENFIALALSLGLGADATEEQVMAKAKELAEANERNVQALAAAEKEKAQALAAEKAKSLVSQALADRKITNAQVPTMQELAVKDYGLAERTIAAMEARTGGGTASEKLGLTKGGASVGLNTNDPRCEYLRLAESSPAELERIRKDDPDKFKQMEDEYVKTL